MSGVTDILNANAEKIRPGDIPDLYEAAQSGTLYQKLKKGGESVQITKTLNGTDFRIPLKVRPAGQYGALSLDGGSFAPGSAAILKQMYQTYFTTQFAIKMTVETIRATQNSGLSVWNAWKNTMKDALPDFMRYNDVSLHNITGSQGAVALATAVSSTGTAAANYTYTFDYEFAANLLQEGMPVEIFDSTLTTWKTSTASGTGYGNLPYVSSINKGAKTAVVTVQSGHTLDNATAANDYLCFPGVTGTPTWMNGLYYFNSTASSGNLLGLSRSTYPELISPSVNASGTLSPLHGILLKSLMRQRTGQYPKKLQGVITDAIAAQIVSMGIAISMHQRGDADKAIDPTPAYDDDINYAQVKHMIDVHASKKRIDWLNLDRWGRVYLPGGEPDFYKEPGSGRMVMTARDSSANPTTAVQFFLTASENFYNVKPADSGFIYGLVPDASFQ